MEPNEAEALLHDWRFWGRPNQLAPDTEWRVWLLLAGRGFGKTRSGAEWVYSRVKAGYRRIALVNDTAADTRDLMIEGPSGVMAVSPPWDKPTYEPSKRRVTWKSGAVAIAYAAESPDILRGPEHDTAWCLVGETLVTMGDNSLCPLFQIRPGDDVLTRNGAKRVTAHALTRQNTTVYRVTLVGGQAIDGTAEHPVYCLHRGWVPIGNLRKGDNVCVINVSHGAGDDGIGTAIATMPIAAGALLVTPTETCFTGQSGEKNTAISRKGIASIISTVTNGITALRTLRYCKGALISVSIKPESAGRKHQKKSRAYAQGISIAPRKWRHVISAVKSSTQRHQLSESFALPPVLSNTAATGLCRNSENANSAGRCIPHLNGRRSIARNNAIRLAPTVDREKRAGQSGLFYATSARRCLQQNARTPGSALDNAPSFSTGTISSVEKLPTRHDVYDITVEDAGEFFANGILVHNCDELAKWKNLRKKDTEGGTAWDNLAMGMRIGPSPRICVTTTPRPLPLIKALRARPTTVETVGSSHDNKSNLSPDWYREVIEPYEGTRLGRQEIYAELLDDVPGALWTLAQLDALRVEDHPPLQRVVIGVDPEASSGDGAAETGIIAAGIARVDGVLHGYVLGDASLRGSPHEWATAAVTAYRTHAADRIVPERNNGGDMVEYTLRTVAANVPVKPVWASRGKLTRAEPVAALYEQQRIHHVGSFPDLEDQLCTWLPGGTSPDRLDALVWAFTELFNLTEREEPPKSTKAPAPMRVADRLRGMGFG